MMMRAVSLCVLVVLEVQVAASLHYEGPKYALASGSTVLSGVVYVSRHGVRTPYGPVDGSPSGAARGDDWSSWTRKRAKGAADYGMSEEAFSAQELTPHGKTLLPLLGSYVGAKWARMGLEVDCESTRVFADDSKRDWQTAEGWLDGVGCGGGATPVHVGNASLAVMKPVLSDSVLFGSGAPATEAQTMGLFGGDVRALTLAFENDIRTIGDALGMEPDAPICGFLGVAPGNCSLLGLPYAYTGVYWQGMFTSPTYYAQFFAEAWMFEYLSNVEDFAFGVLDGAQVSLLYESHISMMAFAANHWNARAYGSAELGWIAAALYQRATGLGLGPALSHATPTSSVVALFVHDTNQLYLRKLLGLAWIAKGWQGNAASTGGALSFELHCQADDAKACFVRTVYTVASPKQQREATKLSLDAPPSEAVLVIPNCGVELCPLQDFVAIVVDAVCFECVDDPLRAVLVRLQDATVPRDEASCRAAPRLQRIALFCAIAAAAGALFAAFLFWCWRLRTQRRASLLGEARTNNALLGTTTRSINANVQSERLTLVEAGTVL